MTIQTYFRQFNGTQISDPFFRDSKWLTGQRCGSRWPGGFGQYSGVVKRDVLKEIVYGGGDEVIVKDGEYIVYQGRLEDPERMLSGPEQSVMIEALGWVTSLKDRKLRYRFAEDNAINRLTWPDSQLTYVYADQNVAVVEKRDNRIKMRMAAIDTVISPTNYHWQEYVMPANNPIVRVTFTYQIRTGEIIAVRLIDGNGVIQWQLNSSTAGPVDVTVNFSGASSTLMRFRLSPQDANTFDQNDWIDISALTVYGSTANTQGGMVQTVLNLAGEFISNDYSLIADPGQTLIPFISRGDGFQNALSMIEDILEFGDASLNQWGFAVWDGGSSSDRLPQAETKLYSTADYEYKLDPRTVKGLTKYSLSPSSREALSNWIAVRYVDEKAVVRYRTPYENTNLTDAASVAQYGQRDMDIDIGSGDAALADAIGQSFLRRYANPKTKGEFEIAGSIPTKGGAMVPVSQIRAGERLLWLPTGETFFLGEVDYDFEAHRARLRTDLLPDRLEMYLAQRKRGLDNNWPTNAGHYGG
jgi:hypothetical protein